MKPCWSNRFQSNKEITNSKPWVYRILSCCQQTCSWRRGSTMWNTGFRQWRRTAVQSQHYKKEIPSLMKSYRWLDPKRGNRFTLKWNKSTARKWQSSPNRCACIPCHSNSNRPSKVSWRSFSTCLLHRPRYSLIKKTTSSRAGKWGPYQTVKMRNWPIWMSGNCCRNQYRN